MIVLRQKEFITHNFQNQSVGGGRAQNDTVENYSSLSDKGRKRIKYIVESCPIDEKGEERDNYIIDQITSLGGRKLNKCLHAAAIAYYHQLDREAEPILEEREYSKDLIVREPEIKKTSKHVLDRLNEGRLHKAKRKIKVLGKKAVRDIKNNPQKLVKPLAIAGATATAGKVAKSFLSKPWETTKTASVSDFTKMTKKEQKEDYKKSWKKAGGKTPYYLQGALLTAGTAYGGLATAKAVIDQEHEEKIISDGFNKLRDRVTKIKAPFSKKRQALDIIENFEHRYVQKSRERLNGKIKKIKRCQPGVAAVGIGSALGVREITRYRNHKAGEKNLEARQELNDKYQIMQENKKKRK